MEFEDAKDSVKDWFNERLKNPYFASVIAVWLVTNRVVVFGLFNFHEDQSLQERVTWVHLQLNSKTVLVFSGFYGIVLYSFLAGLVAMIAFNYINVTGKIVYNVLGRGAIRLLKWLEPSKWISIKEVKKMQDEKLLVEKDLDSRKAENIKLKQDYDAVITTVANLREANQKFTDLEIENSNLQNTISEKEGKIESLEDQIKELKQRLEDKNKEINDRNQKEIAQKNRTKEVLSSYTGYDADQIDIQNFLGSRYDNYFEAIVNSIIDHKPINAHVVPPNIVEYYFKNGLIAFKDNLYVMTDRGQSFYKAYLKNKHPK